MNRILALATATVLVGCTTIPFDPDDISFDVPPLYSDSTNAERPLAPRWPAPDAPCASDTDWCDLIEHAVYP